MRLPSIEKKHTHLFISKDSTCMHGEAMPLDRNSPPKRYPACSIFGVAYTHFLRTQNPLWEKQTSHAATLDGHLKFKRHIWGAMAALEKSGGGTHFEASLARTIFWKARRRYSERILHMHSHAHTWVGIRERLHATPQRCQHAARRTSHSHLEYSPTETRSSSLRHEGEPHAAMRMLLLMPGLHEWTLTVLF